MIETLRVEQLALVESAELEFGPGLNVLTGETGAGKSILLGALGLLVGARASSELVRAGADEAVVEAVFRTAALPDLEQDLVRRGLARDPEGLVVRRTVARTGRTRARVAGELVPVSALAEIFSGRIEIASQHESQALRRPERQAALLDAFGRLEARRAEVTRLVGELRALAREREELGRSAEERARQVEFLAFQVREIDDARLEPGERARLREERARLVHAERLRAEAARLVALLGGDPAGEGGAGARDALGAGRRLAEEMARLDGSLAELAGRLADAEAEVADLLAEAERYLDSAEGDPGRLADLEDRLARLDALARKYGPDEEAMRAHRDRAAAELERLAGSDERLAKLDEAREVLVRELEAAARALSRGRRRAARELARRLAPRLDALGLGGAELRFELPPAEAPGDLPCGPGGLESPLLCFAAAPGEPLRPLRKVASGGELSRIFLALQVELRGAAPGGVLVFDEVDAGIGGAVADRVGAALAELAGSRQVLCITHLPQIAARAHQHFRVAKSRARGRVVTRVEPLDEEGRVRELARMAGGARVDRATLDHARALLASRRPG